MCKYLVTKWLIQKYILLLIKIWPLVNSKHIISEITLYCTFFAIFLELCALPLLICYVKVRCQSIYVWTDMTHILSELWFDLRKTSTILIDSICNVWEISQFGWILIRFPLCSDNFEIEISDKNVVMYIQLSYNFSSIKNYVLYLHYICTEIFTWHLILQLGIFAFSSSKF